MPDAAVHILHEDHPLLVVLKPAGLPTQAPPGIESLESRLFAQLRTREGRTGNIYLALAHRLDRPASGAVICSRNVRAARRLAAQFERRQVRKLYWALVEGAVEPPAGTWHDWLYKIHGRPQAEVVDPTHPGAREAILHYRTLGRVDGGVWLEIELATGRTHQVRVQAAARGHAVLGDADYGATVPFGEPVTDARQRAIALHGRQLEFVHPMSGAPVCVTAPVSSAWQERLPVAADERSS